MNQLSTRATTLRLDKKTLLTRLAAGPASVNESEPADCPKLSVRIVC